MINNIAKFVAEKVEAHILTPTFVTNVRSATKLLSSEYGTFFIVGVNVMKAVQGLGAIATDNVLTKNLLAIAGLVNSTLQLVPSAFTLEELTKLRGEMLDNIESPKPLESRERRIEVITKACRYIATNEKSIRKKLDLAKETKTHKVAERILDEINSDNEEVRKNAINDGEKLMQQLRQRVNTKFGIELAKLSVRTVGVGLAVLAFVAVPAISLPVFIGYGVVGVATLGLYAFEKVMLPKDPFAKPNDVWYEKAGYDFRQGFNATVDLVPEICKDAADKLRNFAL